MARTIAAELTFSGVGLHSGADCKVVIKPAESGGICFKTQSCIYSITEAVVEEDQRLTGFVFPNGAKIRTAEHLLSAISGMGIDNILIESTGDEIPILDGSASVFARAFAKTGFIGERASARSVLSVPVFVDDGRSTVFAMPSKTLKVTYMIDYTGTPIGVQKASYNITEEIFLNVISNARTFCLTTELDFLKSNGLARGGSFENAMVFAQDKMLNDGGLRFPLECVTHKILDLLGDLTLLGRIPTAHYVGICAGHAMHDKLVEKLRRSVVF